MTEASLNPRPKEKPTDRCLDSWKEIATYLNRDVTTVQRWEKREGMPIHRHLHEKRGSVYAFASELDRWTNSRKFPLPGEKDSENNKNGVSALAPAPAATSHFTRRWKFILLPLAFAFVAAACVLLWMQKTDRFWRNPIVGAQFQAVTDWGGREHAAAVSRDGQFAAFLSDRDGQMDVWVTQIGSGQFHNLTHGSAAELDNPSVRSLGFSPDGSLVTYWVRKPDTSQGTDIGIWAVPTLGGAPHPFLEGAAEYDWSRDGRRLAYHTPGPGDPLFVSAGNQQPAATPVFTAPAGLHSHFPLWSPDQKFIYFVQGSLPDKLDVWRIPATGGVPERITSQNTQVSYPVLLDRRTLLYLASGPDGSGPSLYSMDVEHRIPHQLTTDLEKYTSLAASSDGRRLVVTLSKPRTSLWRLRIDVAHGAASTPAPIILTTSSGFRPRLGPDFLVYVSANGTGESIWKLAKGASMELWRVQGAAIIGGPTVSRDGRSLAFSVRQNGRTLLYAMQADGTNSRVVADSLDLQGDPAWAPDGRSLLTAAADHGVPRLFRVRLDGGSPALFTSEPAFDPAWSSDGSFVLFSGPDIGATFSVKAAAPNGSSYTLPPLELTRGARHMVFMASKSAVVLQGEIQHKSLWLVDLDTGAERKLAELPPDFEVRDFDLSPDGREAVLERVQDRSEVALVKLAPQ
jgi:Tol biopolymer transport system component